MIRKFLSTAALGALFVGGLAGSHMALAQPGEGAHGGRHGGMEDREIRRQARLDQRFAALDTDRNGQVSKAEFAAGHQGRGDKGGEGHRWGKRGHHGFGGGKMFRGGGGRGEAMKDGVLTRAEFMAKPLAMFDKADSNKDGFVTVDEMKTARQAMREAWQARRGADAAPRN